MSEKITVILLGHKSLAGKDTFFEAISELGYVRAAFADKLKKSVADLFRFSHEQMYGELKDIPDERYPNNIDPTHFWLNDFGEKVPLRYFGGEEGPVDLDGLIKNEDFLPTLTPRRVLQIYGQQQRSIFEDVWAAYVFDSTIPRLVEEGHNKIVITDFRFKNEGSYGEKWASKDSNRVLHTVKIHRPDVYAKSGANDISEVDLDDYEFMHTVVNNGSLSEFQEKARKFVSSL